MSLKGGVLENGGLKIALVKVVSSNINEVIRSALNFLLFFS